MFKHILVPTDGSPFSQEAARRAVIFAKEAGARITAFYAKPQYPASYYGADMMLDATPPWKLAEQEAQEAIGFIVKLCQEAGVTCEKLIVTDVIVYEGIIDAATKRGCDLIFMASHGRRGVSAVLLGSETTKVLTHSKIPVLVYR